MSEGLPQGVLISNNSLSLNSSTSYRPLPPIIANLFILLYLNIMNLKDYIRSIPDYPKKGILFRDITTLIKDEKAFAETIN